MNQPRRSRFLRRGLGRWQAVLLAVVAVCVGYAVVTRVLPERQKGGRPAASPEPPASRDLVAPPPVEPRYTIAPPMEEQFPEVTAFMRHFLETCLAGDYGAYRKLVSRRCDPEKRERFAAVLHALRSLEVASIQTIHQPDVPDPDYLVVCRVEFHPESQARLRRRHNEVAILVFREDGHWRMMPAPAEWQPVPDEPTDTHPATAPAEPVPDYPWDEDGHY